MNRISRGLLLLTVGAVMMFPTAAFADPPGVAEPRKITEPAVDDGMWQDFQTPETENATAGSDIDGKVNAIEQKVNAIGQKVNEGHSHIFLIIGMIFNLLLTVALGVGILNNKGDIRRHRRKIDELVEDIKNMTTEDNARQSSEELAPSRVQPSEYRRELQSLQAEIKDLSSALDAQRSDNEKFLSDIRAELSRLKSELKIASAPTSFAPQSSPVNQPSPVNRPTPVNRPSSARQLATADQNAELRAISGAFQKMTSDLKASPWDSNTIKANFAQMYRVVAFKCINSSERVNRPELPPVFAESNLNDGTFWGVPISTNGALFVFPKPGLSDYESGRHYQGGFKELFDVPYSGGNYRKIDVELPAVMTRDFKIIRQGKLNLGS